MYEQEIKKLLNIAPEFANIDKDAIADVMDTASLFVNKKFFGGTYTLALVYYTAHLLSIRETTLANGATSGCVIHDVTSEHEGSLSLSYGQSLAKDTFLAQSIYGIMFEQLKKRLVFPILTRMG